MSKLYAADEECMDEDEEYHDENEERMHESRWVDAHAPLMQALASLAAAARANQQLPLVRTVL
jgi:hypothetical protein